MIRVLFVLSCLCGWISSAQAQTLLVLGDSLSAGYQMQAEQSWPALLNEKWQQQGGEHKPACPPCSRSTSLTGC